MSLYEIVKNLSDTQFPLFFLILLLAIVILYGTKYLLKLSAPYFFLGLIGIVIGLMAGSVISSQFASLPGEIGVWFPPILNIFITVAFLDLFLAQGKSLTGHLNNLLKNSPKSQDQINESREKLIIDTSIIIDGRLEKIIETNILNGELLISSLVIQEMKKMTESADQLKILKGRRGLDCLTDLDKNSKVNLKIIHQKKGKSVDESLIILAHEQKAKLLTSDLVLTKMASLAGVLVINLPEVVSSLKPLILPGEEFDIYLLEEGKSKNQAVGYLTDGTMVVVDNGQKQIKKTVRVRVEKVHQTTTGTIIFSRILAS